MPINKETMLKAAAAINALNHSQRLEILRMLQHKECNPLELIDALLAPNSVICGHLKKMRDTGLVTTRKKGNKVYYSVDKRRLAAVREAIELLQ